MPATSSPGKHILTREIDLTLLQEPKRAEGKKTNTEKQRSKKDTKKVKPMISMNELKQLEDGPIKSKINNLMDQPMISRKEAKPIEDWPIISKEKDKNKEQSNRVNKAINDWPTGLTKGNKRNKQNEPLLNGIITNKATIRGKQKEPIGSKNKPKPLTAQPIILEEYEPTGSKNKPKPLMAQPTIFEEYEPMILRDKPNPNEAQPIKSMEIGNMDKPNESINGPKQNGPTYQTAVKGLERKTN